MRYLAYAGQEDTTLLTSNADQRVVVEWEGSMNGLMAEILQGYVPDLYR